MKLMYKQQKRCGGLVQRIDRKCGGISRIHASGHKNRDNEHYMQRYGRLISESTPSALSSCGAWLSPTMTKTNLAAASQQPKAIFGDLPC